MSVKRPLRARLGAWLKRLLYLVATLAVLIYLVAPFVLEKAFTHWALQRGASSAKLESVFIDPVLGQVAVGGLELNHEQEPVLKLERFSVNLSMRGLLAQRALVETLQLEGLDVRIEQRADGQLSLGGLIPLAGGDTAREAQPPASEPADEAAGPGWGIGVQRLAVSDARVRLNLERARETLVLRRLTLRDLASWRAEEPAHATLQALISGTPVNADITTRPFAESLKSQGTVRVENLSLSDYQAWLPPSITKLAGRFNLTQSFRVQRRADGGFHARIEGQTGLTDLAYEDAQAQLTTGKLGWDGRIEATLGAQGAAQVDVQGALTSRALDATGKAPPLRLQHESLSWQGRVRADTGDVPASLEVSGDARIQGLHASETKHATTLAAFDSLAVDGLALNGLADIRTERVTLDKLVLGRPPETAQGPSQALAELARITVSGLKLSEQRDVRIQRVHLDTLNGFVKRSREGAWYLTERLAHLAGGDAAGAKAPTAAPENTAEASSADKAQQPGRQEPATEAPETLAKASAGGGEPTQAGGQSAPAPQPHIQVDELVLDGGGTLKYIDAAVTPTVAESVTIDSLQVSQLNNRKPAQSSPVSVNARIGEYAKLQLEGFVKPFTDKLNLKLTGKLTELALPGYSPYIAEVLGYNIRTGMLAADVEVAVAEDQLDGTTRLTLNNIKLTPDEKGTIEKLQTQLSMPLDKALDLLRDADSNIEVALPLSGDIANPDVGLNDIARQIMAKALKAAAMHYLKNALQPYGTLISVAQFANDQLNKLRLAPIEFQPGETSLGDDAQAYVAKISGMLAERPGLRIKLCGTATPSDRQRLLEQKRAAAAEQPEPQANETAQSEPDPEVSESELLELARARSQTVKARLVDAHEVATNRLFPCSPTLSEDSEAEPGVDVTL